MIRVLELGNALVARKLTRSMVRMTEYAVLIFRHVCS